MSCVFLRYCAALSSYRLPYLFFGFLLVFCIVFAALQPWESLLLLLVFPLVVMGLVFCEWSCCGSRSSGCYSAFVSSFAASLSSVPLCRLLRLLLSSPLFRFPHFQLLLPVFLCFFPRSDTPAAPSRLPPCLFWLATAPPALPVLPLYFHGLWLQLLLALCDVAPVALVVVGLLGVVPLRSCFNKHSLNDL